MTASPAPERLALPLDPVDDRIDGVLRAALHEGLGPGAPPRLRAAVEHAVFPGGARLRPRLVLAVAEACGGATAGRAYAGAAAVELLHCASLVHDDLPCFDDARSRRGRPSVHASFGTPLAVLAGDALIVLAFAVLSRSGFAAEATVLANAAGPARGLVAGQAWESEPGAPVDLVHGAKTAALFEASARLGAMAAGAAPDAWRRFGESLGRAYQAADDLSDAVGEPRLCGKPTGRDAALGRPSLVRDLGVDGARRRVAALLARAREATPPCPRPDVVAAWLDRLAARLTDG